MNASTKWLGIKKVCKDHQAKLVCLLETKVKVDNCGAIFENFISDWKYVHNGEVDNTIQIWLGWDPSFLNVEEIQKTKQFIHAKVSIWGTVVSFLCTVVYAQNTVAGRKDLWEDVGRLASAIATPWAVLGCFNVIRNHNEKIGGDPIRFEAIDDFNTFIEDSGLIDLKWKGEAMTWNNRQSGDARICCKLDRVMVNLAWMDVFRTSEAVFHPPGLSDHSPIVVAVLDEANFGPKPFRFFEAWIGRDGFDDMAAQAELHQSQCNLRDHPDDPNLVSLETQAKVKLWEALAIEEKFLKEKSRVKHIQLGDGNNSFFHKSMLCRQNRSHILEITGEGGDIVKDPSRIKDEAVSFYKKLFGSDLVDGGCFPNSVPLQNGFSLSQQGSLIGRVSNKEIMEVVCAMKNSKAPGPDGFRAAFFKHSWDVVGEDLTLAVKWFFSKSCLPSSINDIFISLIPKTGDVVSDSQSAFIKGRSIVDNILVFHDVVRGIEQK
ncbi:uncharacterized protein LOC122648227, partial [Telopea speciosissima]|uniref:uncharacterized protein LOC122648227 n=1 Tax=Telopea speciosissima TaxID=54955 RepID=UPI001CC7FB6D